MQIRQSSVCRIHCPALTSLSARLWGAGRVLHIIQDKLSFSLSISQLIVQASSFSHLTVHARINHSSLQSSSVFAFPHEGDLVSFTGVIAAIHGSEVIIDLNDLSKFPHNPISDDLHSFCPGSAYVSCLADCHTPHADTVNSCSVIFDCVLHYTPHSLWHLPFLFSTLQVSTENSLVNVRASQYALFAKVSFLFLKG